MEEIVLYIPSLEAQFYKKKEFQSTLMQSSGSISNSSGNVNYMSEERKLYLNSITFGTIEFQFILIDFVRNQITFKRKRNSLSDTSRELYEFLSSMQLEFQPQKMSFVMERPVK